ncbi:hypothetical protein AYK26_04585 [Euryarchaeota archaeon SM23-78]|nr:MAG: hypothetical protein AYK26_04585 [Euryarchaeota archaeon SM23-78]MBW3000715.1 hypothetical protein [Candidatus Woesearchaeota archaeon]
MKNNKKYIKVCPQCGSTITKIPPAGLDIKMTQPDYCNECNNRGIFPEVEEERVEEFRKELKKKDNKSLSGV